MDHFDRCLVCKSEQLKPISKYAKDHLVRCKNCGLVFCSAIPTVNELNEYYADYPRYTSISPITIKRYHEWFDFFDSYRTTNNFLDIGCSVGHLPAVGLERNWKAHGTEVDPESVTICEEKGIRMVSGFLRDHQFEKESFDVITSIEVIEHINTPLEEMELIHDLLRPGGLFFLTTPNYAALDKLIAGKNWNTIGYPEHLTLYTKKSMQRLAKATGFEVLKMETTGVSPKRMIQSRKGIEEVNKTVAPDSNAIDQINDADTDERLRQKMEGSSILGMMKKSVNFGLNLTAKGEKLKAYLIKR